MRCLGDAGGFVDVEATTVAFFFVGDGLVGKAGGFVVASLIDVVDSESATGDDLVGAGDFVNIDFYSCIPAHE